MAEAQPTQRYSLGEKLASGGMATVHLGRLLGPLGFARTVAIKRLHPSYACEPSFVAMLVDEARLASRVRHPSVVSVLDVVVHEGQLWLVLDYVHGASAAELFAAAQASGEPLPPAVAAAVVTGALYGLHAAHEARDDQGEPLHIVHRDVSPQNILVGADGVARIADFGVAKARSRLQVTSDGEVKGKLAYMAPEQLLAREASVRSDVFAAGVVLWELLTGRRLFQGDTMGSVVGGVLLGDIAPPSHVSPGVPHALDAVVARATAAIDTARYASAQEMAAAIESALPPAGVREVAAWVERLCGPALSLRSRLVADMERATAPAAPVLLDALARPAPALPPARASSAVTLPAAPSGSALPATPSGPALPAASSSPTQPATSSGPARSAPGDAPPLPPVLSEAALPVSDATLPAVDASPADPVPSLAPAPRSRWKLPALALASLAALVGGAALLRGATSSPGAGSAGRADGVASATTALAGAAASSAASAAPATPASGAGAAGAAAVVGAAGSAGAAGAAGTAGRPGAAGRPAGKGGTRPKPSCNPPYVLDQQGVRVPKPECL